MSFSKKRITAYSKALFEILSLIKKQNKGTGSLAEINRFKISNLITSKKDKQSENAITVYAIGEELSLLSSLFLCSAPLNLFFKNTTIVESKKLDIFFKIFPGLSSFTRAFLKILSEQNDLYLIPEIANEYNKFLFKFKNFINIKLVIPSILRKEYGEHVLNILKSLTHSQEIILNVSFNPQLLGGFIIEYNSASIDVSIVKEFSFFFSKSHL